MEPYVVGGDYTAISNFPHSVCLSIDCDSSGWICGSSILNQMILLTAAHCVVGCSKHWQIDGFAGHEDLSKVNVVRSVNKFIQHEKYNDRTMINDIALLTLRYNLPLNRYIQRVTIKRTHSPNVLASVAGWGVINDRTREGTDLLKYVKQKVRSINTCHKVGQLLPGMMCAGSTNSFQPRPSQGDSGSALITANHQQIGIVSFRFPVHPGLVIYSNISYFYDWINDKSQVLYCEK